MRTGPRHDLAVHIDHWKSGLWSPLDSGRVTAAQLAAPSYRSNSSGRIQIEAKADMARRGVGSPDRAEAVLLALFEPPRRVVPEVAPLSIPGSNTGI